MNDDGIKRLMPKNKLTTRFVEVQRGVRRSTIIAGRGIRVTQTPDGAIVSAALDSDDGTGTGDETTIIPRWG